MFKVTGRGMEEGNWQVKIGPAQFRSLLSTLYSPLSTLRSPHMPPEKTSPTSELIPRLAAIDIGSNSIRLVVAEAIQDGRYRILDEEREPTRLGRSLSSTDNLDETAIQESLAALRRFQSIAAGLGADNIRAIATCAVREAKNGNEFCGQVMTQLGLPIEVISAEQEAHLAFLSVRRRVDLTGTNTLMADIGGGSTEMILASGELIETIYATSLGAVRLCEMFDDGEGSAGDNYKRLRKSIDRHLRKTTDKRVLPIHLLIGSGGTFTSLAGMVMARKGQSDLPMSGYQISRAEVRHLVDHLRKMTSSERRKVPGLNPDRSDIIIPGLAIIDRIMRRFKINLLQVHVYGVRDGLLLSMLEQYQGVGNAGPPEEREALERFATSCGVELHHAMHVARLGRQIYAGLAEPFKLPTEDVRLLEAAALLKDVGYLISYQGHHKHSYHLILHSRLEAYRPEDLAIIANVARYHRGAVPKNKHTNFRRLCSADQQRVRAMSAILRIAGGLDRSHNQNVQSVQVNHSNRKVELIVTASSYPEVNLWAARRRAGMFSQIFDVDLSVQWTGEVAEAASD
jgi:exopolyphosphatase / guanosine-5'-triphosphate,3'-diphosphate pyrophosphatase